MVIDNTCAIIKYSRPGVEFQYLKLFIQTLEEYILEYKNVDYDKLTDKDKSVALARIIKAMEVNGRPVIEFFKQILAKWEDKDNFEKNQLFVEFMAKEIFGCYDKNREENGEFYKSTYLFCILKNNKKEYFEPVKPSALEININKLKGKTTEKIDLYDYYSRMKRKEQSGILSGVMA